MLFAAAGFFAFLVGLLCCDTSDSSVSVSVLCWLGMFGFDAIRLTIGVWLLVLMRFAGGCLWLQLVCGCNALFGFWVWFGCGYVVLGLLFGIG